MANEEWRAVVGYEGLYEVSDQGRVRSLHRSNPHVLSPGVEQSSGRRSVALRPGIGTRRVYNLVLEAFVGSRPDGAEACHNNGNSSDDRLVNLRWDTVSSNRLDTVMHGRHNHATTIECPRGHPLFPPNLQMAMFRKTGSRACLACHRANSNYRSAISRGLPADFQQLADAHYRKITKETVNV